MFPNTAQSDLSIGLNTAAVPFVYNGGTDSRAHDPDLLKVLHVINGEHFSGAERVQQLLGKRLSKFGYDPLFACVKPNKFRANCKLRGYQIIDAPMRGRFDFKIVGALSNIAAHTDAQVLHAHTPRTALVTAQVSRRTGLPWVYHVHSPTSRDSTRGFINRVNTLIERYSIRKCSLLMTVSKSLRREMLRQGVSRDRLVVVPNGVPALDPIDAKSRLHSNKWRLGMIALMRPRKGVEIALEAMQKIKARNLPVTLELIGGFETDEYQQQTLQLIDTYGLKETVKWTGFTNDIPGAIDRLDALVLPSLFGEGMPMVVLEAISAAVPVIATRVEGTPEVIRDGIEGFLAEPRDAASLADRVTAMISSRSKWHEMSQAALARHRSSFSDATMAQRVARAYDRLVASRVGRVQQMSSQRAAT
jgi:glycosyltransferase involved in cell wall biosynthesis